MYDEKKAKELEKRFKVDEIEDDFERAVMKGVVKSIAELSDERYQEVLRVFDEMDKRQPSIEAIVRGVGDELDRVRRAHAVMPRGRFL